MDRLILRKIMKFRLPAFSHLSWARKPEGRTNLSSPETKRVNPRPALEVLAKHPVQEGEGLCLPSLQSVKPLDRFSAWKHFMARCIHFQNTLRHPIWRSQIEGHIWKSQMTSQIKPKVRLWLFVIVEFAGKNALSEGNKADKQHGSCLGCF